MPGRSSGPGQGFSLVRRGTRERDHGVMPDTPRPPRGPSPRRLFAVAVAAAVACFVLTLSYGYADHAPAPHGVRVDGGRAARFHGAADHRARACRAGRVHHRGGAVRGRGEEQCPVAVSGRRPGHRRGRAGDDRDRRRGRAAQQQAVTAALTAAAAALHRPARLLDVAPLPAGDRAGLSVFVFELGLLIPSVLASIGLYFLGLRLRVWWRVTAAAAFALLAACGSVLVLDAILGALTGVPWALIGVGFAGALTFVAFVTGCQAVTGLPAPGWPRSCWCSPATRYPAGRCRSRSCPPGSGRWRRGCPTAPSCPPPATSPTCPPVPGPPAARARHLAGRIPGRARRRRPAAPSRTPPVTGTAGRHLRDAGYDTPEAAAPRQRAAAPETVTE